VTPSTTFAPGLASAGSLDDLRTHPEKLHNLPPEATRQLLADLGGLLELVRLRALMAGPTATDAPVQRTLPRRCLRPVDVGQLTGLEEAFVQELCRRDRFPGAFKEGKYWIIPEEAYEEWRQGPIDRRVNATLSSTGDGRRGTGDPEAPQAHAGRFRPPRRRPRSHREPVGERGPRDPRADREAAPAPARAGSASSEDA
jgi:hypothetical protein